MYLLQLVQDDQTTNLAVFASLEEGRNFIAQLEAYEVVEDDFVEESLDVNKLPDYTELEMNGHQFPFTKWMFPKEDRVEIYWQELPNLSSQGHGMVQAATRVDAYSINNEDLKTYIQKREATYQIAKDYLMERGFEVQRDFKASEDGEAILYRKVGQSDWHFLSHLDPSFVEDSAIIETIKEWIQE